MAMKLHLQLQRVRSRSFPLLQQTCEIGSCFAPNLKHHQELMSALVSMQNDLQVEMTST